MAIVFGSREAKAIVARDKALRYEHREMVIGSIDCPNCHDIVELIAKTEEWMLNEETGQYEHSVFGCGSGHCDCGGIFVEQVDGRVYQLCA